MSEVVVELATHVTPQMLDAFERLIPQLSRSSKPPTKEQLETIVGSPATHLFLAWEGENTSNISEGVDKKNIVGSLTLVTFLIPTGMRAWIEDVVVDDSVRGKGVGGLLTQAAIRFAQQVGAKTIDLTSRPTRIAANRLYQREGFVQRETNVYRFTNESMH